MRALSTLATAALVVGWIALAANLFETPAQTPSDQAAAPQTAVPSDIPAQAHNRPNPRKATPESIDTGRRVFSKDCATCHGASGDGKGVMIGGGVPDFGKPSIQDRRTDGDLFYIMTEGHGRMLGDGDRLPEDKRWDIVNYIRTLRRPA
jgi:mono/diheme cytochrome c family protein